MSRRPGNRAVKRRVSAFYESLADVRDAVPGVSEVMELAEHESFSLRPAGCRPARERASRHVLGRAVSTVVRGAAIRRGARGSSRPGPRPRERIRDRAVDRGDPSAQRSACLLAPRRRHAARCPLPAWHGRGRRRRRLVRCDPATGRTARARRGRRRGQGRSGGRDHGTAPERIESVLARPDEAVVHSHPSQPPRRGDHGDGFCDGRLRRHRRRRARLPVLVSRSSTTAGRLSGSPAEFLEGGRGLPLGAGTETRYTQEIVDLPVGSTLVLYSDGLVERRGESIDVGLERLRLAALAGPREPEQLVEHLLQRLVGSEERGDDIALLAVRLLAIATQPLHLRLPSDIGSLDLVRDAMRSWLAGAPVSGPEAHDIVLAVWEACANAIEHAVDQREDVAAGVGRPDPHRATYRGRGHGNVVAADRDPGPGVRAPAHASRDDFGRDLPRKHRHAGDAREVPRRSRRTRWLDAS